MVHTEQKIVKAVPVLLPQKAAAPKVFFPNLDGLRFICFLLVFLFHAYKTIFSGLDENGAAYRIIRFLFQNGELGVNFFFVLSGFLITYLLIKEKQSTGTVHLKHFYYRRMLRIWPLFYVCVAIGFIVTPLLKSFAGQTSAEGANVIYYLFFFNNFDYIRQWPQFPDALILIVLWSVAVEEQFYLVWPLVLKYVSRKWLPVLFYAIIIATLFFRWLHASTTAHDYAVRQFHTLSVIGDMALGALMAYYCAYDSRLLRAVAGLKKSHLLFIYAGAIACLLFKEELFASAIGKVAERIVIALFFGAVILEQNFAQQSFFKCGTLKIISRLGIYTYGFYCLHFFVISMVQAVAQKLTLTQIAAAGVCITLVALLFTIAVGVLSYRYFERPFLKLKNRFAHVAMK